MQLICYCILIIIYLPYLLYWQILTSTIEKVRINYFTDYPSKVESFYILKGQK